MNERWFKSASLFGSSTEEKLPYSECPNCGSYDYTTHRKKFRRSTSPKAGQIVYHDRAVLLISVCDNCNLKQNKRLRVFIDEIDTISKYDIDRWDELGDLDGFSNVEFVPKEENQID